jgi:hypothetical protein
LKNHNDRLMVAARQAAGVDPFVLVADYEIADGSAKRALLLMKDEHFYRYMPGDGFSELSEAEARQLLETRLARRRHAVSAAAEQVVRTLQDATDATQHLPDLH